VNVSNSIQLPLSVLTGVYVNVDKVQVFVILQYYLRVLSRPMGIARQEGGLPRTPNWTPVYADYTTEVSQNLRQVSVEPHTGKLHRTSLR
jgi:hypothetical protein